MAQCRWSLWNQRPLATCVGMFLRLEPQPRTATGRSCEGEAAAREDLSKDRGEQQHASEPFFSANPLPFMQPPPAGGPPSISSEGQLRQALSVAPPPVHAVESAVELAARDAPLDVGGVRVALPDMLGPPEGDVPNNTKRSRDAWQRLGVAIKARPRAVAAGVLALCLPFCLQAARTRISYAQANMVPPGAPSLCAAYGVLFVLCTH